MYSAEAKNSTVPDLNSGLSATSHATYIAHVISCGKAAFTGGVELNFDASPDVLSFVHPVLSFEMLVRALAFVHEDPKLGVELKG